MPDGKEVNIQEVYEEFDIRFIRRGSDPAEALDIPFRDVVALISRAAMERMIAEKPASIEVPLIIKPH